uniref:Uncharacterized protein n=1 Tax=Rhizophora mucronata TaxID=61149 RepID=A0A2P2NXQ9_RHIMU
MQCMMLLQCEVYGKSLDMRSIMSLSINRLFFQLKFIASKS